MTGFDVPHDVRDVIGDLIRTAQAEALHAAFGVGKLLGTHVPAFAVAHRHDDFDSRVAAHLGHGLQFLEIAEGGAANRGYGPVDHYVSALGFLYHCLHG